MFAWWWPNESKNIFPWLWPVNQIVCFGIYFLSLKMITLHLIPSALVQEGILFLSIFWPFTKWYDTPGDLWLTMTNTDLNVNLVPNQYQEQCLDWLFLCKDCLALIFVFCRFSFATCTYLSSIRHRDITMTFACYSTSILLCMPPFPKLNVLTLLIFNIMKK